MYNYNLPFSLKIAMLQENQSILRDELQQTVQPNENLAQQIIGMGFDIELVRQALQNSTNDMQKAIENLLKMQSNGTYESALKEAIDTVSKVSLAAGVNGPSTSQAIQNLEDEQQVNHLHTLLVYSCTNHTRMFNLYFQAYDRFAEDMDVEDDAYLDLPLIEERALLDEYKKMLNI